MLDFNKSDDCVTWKMYYNGQYYQYMMIFFNDILPENIGEHLDYSTFKIIDLI